MKDWVKTVLEGVGRLASVHTDPLVYAVYQKLDMLDDRHEEFLVEAIKMFSERYEGLSKQLERYVLTRPPESIRFVVGEKVLSSAEVKELLTGAFMTVPPSLYGQVTNGGKCDGLIGECECGARHSRSEFADRLERNGLVLVLRKRSPFDSSG